MTNQFLFDRKLEQMTSSFGQCLERIEAAKTPAAVDPLLETQVDMWKRVADSAQQQVIALTDQLKATQAQVEAMRAQLAATQAQVDTTKELVQVLRDNNPPRPTLEQFVTFSPPDTSKVKVTLDVIKILTRLINQRHAHPLYNKAYLSFEIIKEFLAQQPTGQYSIFELQPPIQQLALQDKQEAAAAAAAAQLSFSTIQNEQTAQPMDISLGSSNLTNTDFEELFTNNVYADDLATNEAYLAATIAQNSTQFFNNSLLPPPNI